MHRYASHAVWSAHGKNRYVCKWLMIEVIGKGQVEGLVGDASNRKFVDKVHMSCSMDYPLQGLRYVCRYHLQCQQCVPLTNFSLQLVDTLALSIYKIMLRVLT